MQTLDEIKQEFMHHIFLKAVEETETIIGSVRVWLEKETAYIGRLMVKPEYENRGIGTLSSVLFMFALRKKHDRIYWTING